MRLSNRFLRFAIERETERVRERDKEREREIKKERDREREISNKCFLTWNKPVPESLGLLGLWTSYSEK